MADLGNPGDPRQERLFSLFLELIKSHSGKLPLPDSSLSDKVLDDTIGPLESQPLKRGDIAPISIDEILRRKEIDSKFNNEVAKIGLRKFYDEYNDFIISVRTTLVNGKGVDSSIFKIQTIASPGIDAYEPTGFNNLDITPLLSSYARVL